jgi:uncharacterized protein (DUF885 family)
MRVKGLVTALGAAVLALSGAASADDAQYEALLELYEEFRGFTVPPVIDGAPDYRFATMQARRGQVGEYLERLGDIDDSAWPVNRRAEYMLVLAEMRGLLFQHEVLQPWRRDPAFYSVTNLGFGPKMHGAFSVPSFPMSAEAASDLRASLLRVPDVLAQARENLTDARGDLARLAIVQKDVEVNVFTRLAADAETHDPDLVEPARRAAAASAEFRDWLAGIESSLPAHGGVGADNYAWYLKHVLLFPYGPEEIAAIGEREYERVTAFLALEENRNRDVPELEVLTSREEFDRRRMEADNHLLDFLRDREIMTVPDYLAHDPDEGPYILPSERDPDRPGLFEPPLDLHFFFQAEFRDGRPLRAHNLPGHMFDRLQWSMDERPIRGDSRLFFVNGIRSEGWAQYLEEMILQAGMLDDRPRTREITYVLAAKRAARLLPELRMQANEWTYAQARASLVQRTPRWMQDDDAIAAFDIELYLRQPGYGIGYYMGKVELESLLSERFMALGDDFVLRDFHDAFRAAGPMPISLIRWEMTGDGAQVEALRETAPIPDPRP